MQIRLDALVVCILRPERRHGSLSMVVVTSMLLSAKVAEAEVGFRLHAAKVASLACNGPAQMKSFYLIPHPAPLLSDVPA